MLHSDGDGVEEHEDDDKPEPGGRLAYPPNEEPKPFLVLPQVCVGLSLSRLLNRVGLHARLLVGQFLHLFSCLLTGCVKKVQSDFCFVRK